MANTNMDTYSTSQQVNQDLLRVTNSLWLTYKATFIKAGISAAAVYAACQLIPDHAVMSKEELEKGEELPKNELLLRKSVIPGLIMYGKSIPSGIRNIFLLLKTPGIQSKLLAFASILSMTPAFLVAYQILKRKIENQEPTLNIRELMKDSPINQGTALKMSLAGQVSMYPIANGPALYNLGKSLAQN